MLAHFERMLGQKAGQENMESSKPFGIFTPMGFHQTHFCQYNYDWHLVISTGCHVVAGHCGGAASHRADVAVCGV